MLHEVTAAGGLGFCHAVLHDVFPVGHHGPLVVALDSNILIDLQQNGRQLLNQESVDVGGAYAEELLALGTLIDIWMMRDVRFIVTPRSRTDAKRVTERFMAKGGLAIGALAESLAFQYGDWTVPAPSDTGGLAASGTVDGIPDGADRDLVREALSAGAHLFLTRDRTILEQPVVSGRLRIMSPSGLADALVLAGVQPFAGGLCPGNDCPYKLRRHLSIVLEVSAENSAGFPVDVARTVRENSKVLGFDVSEFEDVEW